MLTLHFISPFPSLRKLKKKILPPPLQKKNTNQANQQSIEHKMFWITFALLFPYFISEKLQNTNKLLLQYTYISELTTMTIMRLHTYPYINGLLTRIAFHRFKFYQQPRVWQNLPKFQQ